jgi:hypothetical protein
MFEKLPGGVREFGQPLCPEVDRKLRNHLVEMNMRPAPSEKVQNVFPHGFVIVHCSSPPVKYISFFNTLGYLNCDLIFLTEKDGFV